jgi:hypothetical protein
MYVSRHHQLTDRETSMAGPLRQFIAPRRHPVAKDVQVNTVGVVQQAGLVAHLACLTEARIRHVYHCTDETMAPMTT